MDESELTYIERAEEASNATAYQARVRHYSGPSTTADTYESKWSDTWNFTTTSARGDFKVLEKVMDFKVE